MKQGGVSIVLANGKITMVGDVEHTGNVKQTGDQTTSGTITGQTDVVAAGISGKGHTHGGVTAGGANTGVPQ